MIHYYPELQTNKIEELYHLLQKVKLNANNERQGKKMGSGKTGTFGFVWVAPTRKGNKYVLWALSRLSTKYPLIQMKLDSLIKQIDPTFDYTTIQINKDTVCNPHIDDSNTGESILVSIGDYSGGNLCIKIDDTIETISTNLRPIRFNGSQHFHWNTSIQSGTKYSIVFYNRRKNTYTNKFLITTNYKQILENPSIEPTVIYEERL
jgi:hypothetical protein